MGAFQNMACWWGERERERVSLLVRFRSKGSILLLLRSADDLDAFFLIFTHEACRISIFDMTNTFQDWIVQNVMIICGQQHHNVVSITAKTVY